MKPYVPHNDTPVERACFSFGDWFCRGLLIGLVCAKILLLVVFIERLP